MFLSCKCLNITIKIRDNCELKPIKIVNYRDNHFEPVLSQSSMHLTSTIATATLATATPPKKIDSSKIAGEFFQQDLQALIPASPSNYEIIKQQQPLIYEKVVDNWIINRCVNCMMYTHALNQRCNNTKKIANNDDDICDDTNSNNSNYHNYNLLINKMMILLTDNDINNSNNNVDNYEKLKSHFNYSKIYKIIVNKSFNNSDNSDNDEDDNDNEYNLLLKKKLSNTLQLTISHLQQQYEMGYQKMKEQIDEKIKKFTAEQYEFLDEFKEHGHKEYRTLVNRICDSDLIKMDDVSVTDGDINKLKKFDISHETVVSVGKPVLSTNGSTLPPVESVLSTKLSDLSINEGFLPANKSFLSAERSALSIEMKNIQSFEGIEQNNGDSKILRLNNSEIDNKIVDKQELKKKEKKKNFKNIEDEVIFPLEGMDDSDNVEISEDEVDTDDSGQDEGIHIPRGQRGGHPTLAKSLPVSVPNISFGRRIQDQDDDQLSMDPHDPHNIRASIKALAKSVHGDTVFGDLPRPRFSTQI